MDREHREDKDKECHWHRWADGERYLDRESGHDRGDRNRDRHCPHHEYRERSKRRERHDRDRSDDHGYRGSCDHGAERGDRDRDSHRRHISSSCSASQRILGMLGVFMSMDFLQVLTNRQLMYSSIKSWLLLEEIQLVLVMQLSMYT